MRCTFIGERRSVLRLKNRLVKLKDRVFPYACNKDYYNNMWLGCIAKAIGESHTTKECSGIITDFKLGDGRLTMSIDMDGDNTAGFHQLPMAIGDYYGLKTYYSYYKDGESKAMTNDVNHEVY